MRRPRCRHPVQQAPLAEMQRFGRAAGPFSATAPRDVPWLHSYAKSKLAAPQSACVLGARRQVPLLCVSHIWQPPARQHERHGGAAGVSRASRCQWLRRAGHAAAGIRAHAAAGGACARPGAAHQPVAVLQLANGRCRDPALLLSTSPGAPSTRPARTRPSSSSAGLTGCASRRPTSLSSALAGAASSSRPTQSRSSNFVATAPGR